jgi:hypothetical protein
MDVTTAIRLQMSAGQCCRREEGGQERGLPYSVLLPSIHSQCITTAIETPQAACGSQVGAVRLSILRTPKTRKDRPNTSPAHASCSCVPRRGAGAAIGSSKRPAPPPAARHSSTAVLPLRSLRRGRLLGFRGRGAAAAAAAGGDPTPARGRGPERARAGLLGDCWLTGGYRDGCCCGTQQSYRVCLGGLPHAAGVGAGAAVWRCTHPRSSMCQLPQGTHGLWSVMASCPLAGWSNTPLSALPPTTASRRLLSTTA